MRTVVKYAKDCSDLLFHKSTRFCGTKPDLLNDGGKEGVRKHFLLDTRNYFF